MALSQTIEQKLQHRLTAQQIALLKLLQIPTANIAQRIEQEIENNPTLEYVEGGIDKAEVSTDTDESKDEGEQLTDDGESQNEKPAEGIDDFEEYADDDEYGLKQAEDKISRGEKHIGNSDEMPTPDVEGFQDMLIKQIPELDLSEQDKMIAEHLIYSLDEDGYLYRDMHSLQDEFMFKKNLDISLADLERVIKKIQELEPDGIGARSLQECLRIQIMKKEHKDRVSINALAIIDELFNDFVNNHFETIQKSLGIDADLLKQCILFIQKLNPKPGGDRFNMYQKKQTIIPDFYVLNNAGVLTCSLNSFNDPKLTVSDHYKMLVKEYATDKAPKQKEALTFIKQKMDAARSFIDLIKQRQDTLLRIMHAIIEAQKDFFIFNSDASKIKPLLLKEIEQASGRDATTISRVVTNKYVQTEYGIFSLKIFFQERYSEFHGIVNKNVTINQVKQALKEIIDLEDKQAPYSDTQLMKKLEERGIQVIKRTVAYYREELNIPKGAHRKKISNE